MFAETDSACEGAYKRLHVSIAFMDKWVSSRSLRWGDRSTQKEEQWRQCAVQQLGSLGSREGLKRMGLEQEESDKKYMVQGQKTHTCVKNQNRTEYSLKILLAFFLMIHESSRSQCSR